MKFLILFAFILFSFSGISQNREISEALGKGNVNTLKPYLDNRVEVALEGEVNFYESKVALGVLENFFQTIKPRDYKSMHTGSSRGNSSYAIGRLISDGGDFRVYLYFVREQDQWFLQELRFDKET